jgi:hypothetical protein
MLSEEELSSWEEAFASGGIPGLYGKRLRRPSKIQAKIE